MMRWLIEVRPDAAADVWYPARFPRGYRVGQRQAPADPPQTIAVWDQFADADRVFKDALKCAPNYRLIETEESNAQLEARRY